MHKRARVVAVLAGAAVALAACGGGDSGGDSDTSPIKIGMIASLTGVYGPLGSATRPGAEFAVQEINDAGGIDGRQLELVVRDDQSKPDQAVVAFNDLASEVSAFVGPAGNQALATADLAERQGIPVASPSAQTELFNPVRDNVFVVPYTSSDEAEKLLAYFQTEGITKIYVIADTSESGASTGWATMRAGLEEAGVTAVKVDESTLTTTDFSPSIARIPSSGAQAVMVWLAGPPAIILAKQAAAAKIAVPAVYISPVAEPYFVQGAGAEAIEGSTVVSAVGVVADHLPDSEIKTVAVDVTKRYTEANGQPPDQFALWGYSAVRILAAAIDAADSSDPEAIQQALNKLTVTTPMGTVTYTPEDHSGPGEETLSVNKIVDGKFVPVPWALDEFEKTFA